MKIGTRVRIERDEANYGTSRVWREFKGRTGVVTGTSLGEVGVEFDTGPIEHAWFQKHEVKRIK